MTKVILIAALSADGYIGKSKTHLADWTSKEDKQHFVATTKESGVIIMGRVTYETIGKALPDRRTIVLSRSYAAISDAEVSSLQPKELLASLSEYDTVCICGGQQIYSLFMEAGVVDELQLTIEPVLFGQGVTLFNDRYARRLRLQSSDKLNSDTLLQTYEVL